MRLANPPVWREATAEETADYLAGYLVYTDDGNVAWTHESPHEGLLILTGDALPCGCIPHNTYMTGFGFHCETEDQGYCNFECPHDEED